MRSSCCTIRPSRPAFHILLSYPLSVDSKRSSTVYGLSKRKVWEGAPEMSTRACLALLHGDDVVRHRTFRHQALRILVVGRECEEGDVFAGRENEVRVQDRQPTLLACTQKPQDRILTVKLLAEASCELLPREASSHRLPIEGEEGEAAVGQEGSQIKGSLCSDPSHKLFRVLEHSRVRLCCTLAASPKGASRPCFKASLPIVK